MSGDSQQSCNPGWELELETVLVKRNLKEATKGSHEPRPLVTPIYTSSTYLLESAKEGEALSMNHAKVSRLSVGVGGSFYEPCNG
jgi:hypothetical protein